MMRRPEELHAAFANAINHKDLDALPDLFTHDAKMMVAFLPTELTPETLDALLTGSFNPKHTAVLMDAHEAIGEPTALFMSLSPYYEVTTEQVILAGSIAYLRSSWSWRIIPPEGLSSMPVEVSGHGIEIMVRQDDGSWLCALNHPFGADLLPQPSPSEGEPK